MTTPQPIWPIWQYDETQQVGTDYRSQEEIQRYDRRMQKLRNVEEEIREILALLDLRPESTVLEIGTGTGEFPIAAAARCARVIAADVSGPMLEYAESKARARLPCAEMEKIQFVQAGFLTYQHQGPPLDAVVSQLALHHLPDFWKQVALMRVAGMLKEGGRLYLQDVVYSFQASDYQTFFDHYLSRMAKLRGQESAEDITAHIRDEYSTLGWILEGMMKRAGLSVEKAEYKYGFIATYLCSKR
jgi:putative AdoMet-dependent methyltransferase